MKTVVSLPDDLFEEADSLAERLGVSRSQLYATALAEYLARHRDADVTAKLNELYAIERGGLSPRVRSAQARSVNSSEW
jgi:metal-responsive CopG/Arc/MetJ family transcriptional regulator